MFPFISAKKSSVSCMFLAVIVTAGVQPRTARAAAVPPVADFPLNTTGFVNGCKYQVWTNGVATPAIVATPSPAITGLGTPAFSGILAATSVPPVTTYINVVNGNSTWSVPNGGQTSNVCVQWDAYFFASAAGTYTFTTSSSDGSALFIGNTQVVFNNFVQTKTSRSGLVQLEAGFHAITVIFGKGTGNFDMTATSSFNNGTPVDINANLFLRLLNTPTFLPAGGSTGISPLNVTISVTGAPGGTVINYTTDGSTPDATSLVYQGSAIQVSVPATVKAIATAANFDGSLVGSVTYTQLPTAGPIFSVASGPYTGAKTLSISSTTAGAFIFYTTDGTTPTFQNYTSVGPSPVTYPLTTSVTINAFASAFGFAPTSVATAVYTRTDVAPAITSCLASGVPTQVNVAFSSAVTTASANNLAHYAIDNGVTVSSAALDTDNKTVRLTVSSMTPGILYNLTVTNISDTAATPNVLTSATTKFQYFNGGGLLYERWENVSGSKVSDLTNAPLASQRFFPDFPSPAVSSPAGGFVTASFEASKNTSILSYGSRMSGYFIAPATGQYNFAVSANDTAAFSMSSDDNPFKKSFVTAKVTVPSNSRQWNYDPTAPPENKTGTISLVAGKRYYIELLHKQDAGPDNAAVAYVFPPQTFFDNPGSETAPVSKIFDPNSTGSGPIQLSPAIDALRVISQPTSVAATLNQAVRLVFDVSGSAPRTVQWSLDKGSGPVDIPGANFGIYTIPNLSAGDAGTYVCRMTNSITTTPLFSSPAVVTLIDTTPATVTSVVDNFDTLAGGKTIVITGTHFIQGTAVVINGKSAAILTVTPATITCVVPSSTVKGTVNLSVTKPGLAAITLAGGFAYDDIPAAVPQTITIFEDTPTAGLTLTATDASEKIVSFKITRQPAKGTVTLRSAALTNKASTGTIVTMTTDTAHSFTAGQTVSVACNPADANIDMVNAVIASVPTPTTFTFNKSATAVASAATGGTVQLITNTPATKPFTGSIPFTYTPNPDANNSTAPGGPDTFQFSANDGIIDSLPITVTINITPVNDGPAIANPGNRAAPVGVPQTVPLTGIAAGPADEITLQTITSITASQVSGTPGMFLSQDGLNTNTLKITQFTGSTAVLSFTPAFVGTATIAVTVIDSGSSAPNPGGPPNVNSTVIQFTIVVKELPTFTSAPAATPNPAGVGQTVQFSTSASDASALITWDFGDGSSGSGTVVTHAYATAEIFTVTATASADVGNVSGIVQVTVAAPLVGAGNDSDGDGFSDDFETVAGSNGSDSASTPTGQPATAATVKTFSALKPSIKLNFAKAGKDTIAFGGAIDIPAGFVAEGKKFIVDVGGAIKSFPLSAKGAAKTADGKVKLTIKSSKGMVAAQSAKFKVSFAKSDYAAALKDEGLTDDNAKKVPVTVAYTVVLDTVLQGNKEMTYTAKKGKSGSAK